MRGDQQALVTPVADYWIACPPTGLSHWRRVVSQALSDRLAAPARDPEGPVYLAKQVVRAAD